MQLLFNRFRWLRPHEQAAKRSALFRLAIISSTVSKVFGLALQAIAIPLVLRGGRQNPRDRRQLELPVVLPHLRLLPGLPHVNVTRSELDLPPLLIFDWSVVEISAVCRRRRKKLFGRRAGMNTEDERSSHAHAPVFESAL